MNVSDILKSLTPREFDAGHAFSGRPTGTKVTGYVRAGETALKNSVCRMVLAESERFRMGRNISFQASMLRSFAIVSPALLGGSESQLWPQFCRGWGAAARACKTVSQCG